MVEREIFINAPIETVFQVIGDFESYPKFLSTTKQVRQWDVEGVTHAEFTIELMREVSYTLKFQVDEPERLEWSLVEGDYMKKNEGGWQLTPMDGGTKALYRIHVEFGWMVPAWAVDKLTKTQLPATLEAFKKRAEELS